MFRHPLGGRTRVDSFVSTRERAFNSERIKFFNKSIPVWTRTFIIRVCVMESRVRFKGRAFDSRTEPAETLTKQWRRRNVIQWVYMSMISCVFFMLLLFFFDSGTTYGPHVAFHWRIEAGEEFLIHNLINSRRRSSLAALVAWLIRLRLLNSGWNHCDRFSCSPAKRLLPLLRIALMWRSNKRSQQSHARRSRQHFCLFESRNR